MVNGIIPSFQETYQIVHVNFLLYRNLYIPTSLNPTPSYPICADQDQISLPG